MEARKRYRILTEDRKVKFAGTGMNSWFSSIDEAKKFVDYSNGEMIYEFNHDGDMLWEVL